MGRIFVIGLLACLVSGGTVLPQSSSEPTQYLHLDPASDRLYQEGQALGSMLTNHVQATTHAEEKAHASGGNLWLYLAMGVGVILTIRKAAPIITARIGARDQQPRRTVVAPAETSSGYPADVGHLEAGQSEAAQNAALSAESEALEQFFGNVGEDLSSLRKSVGELGRATLPEARQNLVGQLLSQVRALKSKSNLSGVRPFWQLTYATEGLLEQLSHENEEFQISALRTLASAIDLLHSLSVRGLRANLLTQPSPRLLSVDDDPVSRYAVAAAIKRYLLKPDSATGGEAALGLVEETPYDLILLDVQMPGMDGFELCSRIHGTARNRTTPIVFVTCQNDLEARAKSTLTGGQDLLGKPFMASELSLKALTLVLRRRLQSEAAPAVAPKHSKAPSAQPPKATPSKPSEPLDVLEPAFSAAAVAAG